MTSDNEPEDLIRYDILAQEALRGVVRKVLHEVARTGLPGDHHFYITFATRAPGVRISMRMREKYPEEMTIVVQHQFWDLEVTETGFSVGLSFDNIPETLLVPYSAISGFFDPSVQFGLQFDMDPAVADEEPARLGTDSVSALPAPREVKEDDAAAATAAASDEGGDGAQVVSLDAFRKK